MRKRCYVICLFQVEDPSVCTEKSYLHPNLEFRDERKGAIKYTEEEARNVADSYNDNRDEEVKLETLYYYYDTEVVLREPIQNFYVGVYLKELAYGGHEEGGWWYDTYQLQTDRRVFIFHNEDECIKFVERYRDRLDKWVNSRRRSYTSVLSDGVYDVCWYEGNLPKYFPEKTPHYYE